MDKSLDVRASAAQEYLKQMVDFVWLELSINELPDSFWGFLYLFVNAPDSLQWKLCLYNGRIPFLCVKTRL